MNSRRRRSQCNCEVAHQRDDARVLQDERAERRPFEEGFHRIGAHVAADKEANAVEWGRRRRALRRNSTCRLAQCREQPHTITSRCCCVSASRQLQRSTRRRARDGDADGLSSAFRHAPTAPPSSLAQAGLKTRQIFRGRNKSSSSRGARRRSSMLAPQLQVYTGHAALP